MPDFVKVGMAAKMMNISPELLRHYEKRNVVLPSRVDASGYRYYSRKNLTHLAKARFLMSLGFSIDEVAKHNSAKLLAGAALEDWMTTVQKHRIRLKHTIEKQQQMLATMDDYLEKFAMLSRNENIHEIVHSKEMLFFKFSDGNDDIVRTKSMIEDIRKCVELYPVSRYAILCSQMHFENKLGANMKRGFAIPLSCAGSIDIQNNCLLDTIAAKLCVHAISGVRIGKDTTVDLFSGLVSYIHENGLDMDGDGIGLWIATIREENAIVSYFDLWIPIKG